MNQMNLEQARYNMIEQQIRPWEVLDDQVLGILSATPREDFVPEKYRSLAFAEIPEIDRLAFELGMRPGHPDTEVMIMVLGMYTSQHRTRRRP